MKDLKNLRQELHDLINSLSISDESLTKEWQNLMQMERVTSACFLEGDLAKKYGKQCMGHEMEDIDYLLYCDKGFPLSDWIKEQRARRLNPFGIPSIGTPSQGGDISALPADEVTKILKGRKR